MNGIKVRNLLSILFFSLAMLGIMLMTAVDAEAISYSWDVGNPGDHICSDTAGPHEILGTTKTNRVIVRGGTAEKPIEIHLHGVNMDLRNENSGEAPLTVEKGYYAVIYLDEGYENTLYGSKGRAGLSIKDGAHVTIKNAGDKGKLTAYGGSDGAGIGGNSGESVKNLTIEGNPTIEAHGGSGGAGIGGGKNGYTEGINIKGGTITATGGSSGAGIGSANGDCKNLTISGGTITATGGSSGAGVGSGRDGKMFDLTIESGKITAKGGSGAAGIGAGDHVNGGDGGDLERLTIKGGIIDARSDSYGAGIGGSDGGTVDSLVIDQTAEGSGLQIEAHGGIHGAGIGSASHKVRDMSITLRGGSIKAYGGESAAGIGGGDKSGDTDKIDIRGESSNGSNGSIEAYGGVGGAGIGAGPTAGTGAITITGDPGVTGTGKLNITAWASNGITTKDKNGAAAIGSAKGGGGNISISYADLKLHADDNGAGIGSGRNQGANIGVIDKITVNHCDVRVYGNNRNAAGIGSGLGSKINNIAINDCTYRGNTIGSSAMSNHFECPNDINTIKITNSDIEAIANTPTYPGSWAGIGTGSWGAVNSITIENSKITAKGLRKAAGIGTGGWDNNQDVFSYYGGKMGTISIKTSTVNSTGGEVGGGAGIGGGYNTSTGDITIDHSKVTAATNTKAHDGAAGIGGGHATDAGKIKIIGNSEVTATGGNNSAGIGCSGEDDSLTVLWNTKVKSIAISNSKVTATGGSGGAGIGTGRGGRLDDSITVTDSTVTARGGAYGAGIGGGGEGEALRGADIQKITIEGDSKVEAHGGDGAAGIGGGMQGGADDLHFNLTTAADRSYYVKAYGGAGAAGIGSGSPNESDHDLFTQEGYRTNGVVINGGYIYAQGGGKRGNLGSGSGIGGGARKGTLHGFNVTGGYVEAHSGAGDAFDIGHGGEGGVPQAFKDDDFHISGGTVTADRISTDAGVRISGGSVRCSLSGVKNEEGTKVYKTTLTLADAPNTLLYGLKTSAPGYGTNRIFSDQNSRIYLYLPESQTNKATADVTLQKGSSPLKYYGTAKTDGSGVMKMDGTVVFGSVEPQPAAGGDFVLSLADDDLSGWTFDFKDEAGSAAKITEIIEDHSPGAKVKLHGSDFGAFAVTAVSKENKDDVIYWSLKGTYKGNITVEQGTIAITENPSKTYDGKAITDPTVEKNGDGSVTYQYYQGDKAEGTPLAERPVNAGTYTAVATMAASSHYTKAVSEPLTFTIEKRPLTIGLSAASGGTDVTVTASLLGAVDANGTVKFTVGGQSETKRVQEKGGMYIAEFTHSETSAGDYTVTAEHQQTQPENYSYTKNPVSQTFKKNLAFREIHAADSFVKTYGDKGFPLEAKTDHTTGTDVWTYELAYEEFPNLERTIAVDENGQVTVINAGYAVIKVTLSDGEDQYNDAVKYVPVTVKRAPLEVTSSAKDKAGNSVTEAQYGTLSGLTYELTYHGFKNGDSETDFTNGHGSLKAVKLIPTLGVHDSYEIDIAKVGAALEIGDKAYQNVFFSRNYELDLKKGAVKVTPAELTVKADDITGQWNRPPEYTYTTTGFTAWDTAENVFRTAPAASLDTRKTGGKEYGKELEPGTYVDGIQVSEGEQKKNKYDKENYAVEARPGTLTVEKADPELAVTPTSKSYDGKPAEIAVHLADDSNIDVMPQTTYYKITEDGDVGNPAVLAALRKSAEPLPEAPVNAGRYYVEVTTNGSNHFKGDTAGAAYVIFKANPNPELPNLPDLNMKTGLTLADQALPAGWEWIYPDKALNLGEVRALAKYTPEDQENYRNAYRYLGFSVVKEEPKPSVNPDDKKDGGSKHDGSGESPKKVSTGDEGRTWPWLLAALLSGCVLIAVAVGAVRRKQSRKEKR